MVFLSAKSHADGLIVPAYFYPGTGGPGGVGDGWAAMTSAASQVPLVAVFNPNSGPLPGPADPNYTTALTNLETAGGKVVAYIYTDDGRLPLSNLESQISTYNSQYGSLIDGFYLDGMFVLPTTLSYYESLDSYIKGSFPSDLVIGNPGQPFLNGVSQSNYLSTANTFDIFEGSHSSFAAYPYSLTWFQSHPSSDFDNTIYGVPNADLSADLNRAASLSAGWVYVTDQSGGNPYGQLPSYWDQEVAAIHSLNSAVPEPPSAGLLFLGLLVIAPGPLLRRRSVKFINP